MKQTDLRIGNYIRYRDEWDCEVQSLGSSFETHNKDLNNYLHGIRCGSGDIEDYNPIKVTEEWLLKLGLELHSKYSYYNYKLPDGFVISMWMEVLPCAGFEEMGVCYYGDNYLAVKYVHQLQNLYFALTGKELELTPCN